MLSTIRVTKHSDRERETLFRLFWNGQLKRNIFIPNYMANEFERRMNAILTSAIHLDGEEPGQYNVRLKTSELPKWKPTSKI